MKKILFFLIVSIIICTLINCKTVNKNEVSENEFFYQFEGDEFTLDVLCELNYFEGFFSGTGTLQISRIKDTKIDGFYEISLTNLRGNCDEHGDNIFSGCIYSGEFPIGYFYVSEDRIYMMEYDEDYLPLLCEMTSFPSMELIEQWNTQLREQGEHRGYFGYRLCCDDEGMEDTFGEERNAEEIALYGEMAGDYHNYIEVKEDKRLFNLYPDKIMGTQEYMQIIWEKDQGITSFAKWAGNYKNYISFHVYESEEYINSKLKNDNSVVKVQNKEYQIFFGTWQFTEVVSQHGRLGGDEGYEDLIGQCVTYSQDLFENGETSFINPEYSATIIPIRNNSCSHFFIRQISLKELLPEADFAVFIQIIHKPVGQGGNYYGTEFLIKDNDTMYSYDNNCIYKLTRINYLDGYDEKSRFYYQERW